MAALLLVGTGAQQVLASDLPPKPSGRLELQLGAGWRDDSLVAGPVDATASGGALSELGGRGAWFGAASHLGVAARFRLTRFALTGERGVSAPDHVDVTGIDAAVGIAVRAHAGSRVSFEGQLGYGYLRIPVVFIEAGPAGDARYAGGALRGHGPSLRAAMRVAISDRVGLELAAEGTPLAFAADYGGTAVSPRRLGGRAAVTVDCLDLAGARWSALASYELSRTTASGDAVDITHRQQQFGLGLRATWRGASVPRPTPIPGPVLPAPAAPQPSTISGAVRAEGGRTVAARIAIPELGLQVMTDAAGGFRFDVRPGRYTLTIEAAGWVSQSKPVMVGPGEQRIYNIELQPEPR